MKQLLISLLLSSFCIFSTYSQLTGGRANSQKNPSASEPGTLSGGTYSGDVNIFTGEHQSSIPLGSVSTPSGLSYDLELNRGSSFSFGANESMVKGLLYGDGWSLNIPMITVTTDIFHRFGNGAECDDNITGNPNNTNTEPSNYDRSWEGDIFWFEPYISIPGVGSGRAVFKYVDASDADCAVFVLNKFSTPVEIRYYGSSWVVTVGDGTVYVFEGTVRQFAAPSNKRLYHYKHNEITYSSSDEGSNVLVNNAYPIGTGVSAVNVIEPKTYYNSWYCSRIFHPNHYGQNIVFEYEKYGKFNFFQEFQQKNYEDVHRSVYQDLSSNSYLPDYTTYRDIVLQRVIASTVDGNSDIIELEYGIDNTLSSSFLMTPGVFGAVATDPMYCSKVVERFDGTSTKPYSNWKRYPHANRDNTLNPWNINSVDPYINATSNYIREGVTAIASGIPFNHGFLESPRINNTEELVAGDLYEIRTRITRPDGTNLKNGNGTVDISVVTNGTTGATVTTSNTDPGSPLLSSDYSLTRGEQIFSTFNMAMKWQMGYNETELQTSNLFVMPSLPANFNGFNIQVGPGNSDIAYDYYNSYELYGPGSAPNSPNAKVAYPQLRALGIKSSSRIAANFGTGHPWGMMFPVYNHRALYKASPMPDYDNLYKGTWSVTSADNALYGSTHNPTKFDASVKLQEVELVRHGRTAYMLQAVKQYRMEGEYGGPITTGKKLVAQKRIRYTITNDDARQNRTYSDGNIVVIGTDNMHVILLKSVHEVPLEGDLYALPYYGLSTDVNVLTTEFEYTNVLPASGTYSSTTPYVGLVYHALTKIIDNLGGITEIEYYPINAAPTRTYSTTNFNWNCGMYTPASYGVEKSFNMNLAVRYITKRSADYNATTQTFSPSTQRWEYVYDLTKLTYSFKRIKLPGMNFRGQYFNTTDRGYAKVTVYEPALETGERNYTIHEFFGNVNYPYTFPGTTTIADYLYYGKPKSVKKYDHSGKVHYTKDYAYSYTMAYEDGYGRPNFYRENLNTYYQPIIDGYEYRDYYRAETPLVNTGVTILTGNAAKWALADRVRGIGGKEGYLMEHPKYLPFYFYTELRTAYTITDVDGNQYTGYVNPTYAFNSYFVKLASETERTFEDGLAFRTTAPVVPGVVKNPVPPNPFGDGVVDPLSTTGDNKLYTYISTHTGSQSYEYLMQYDNLSVQVQGFVGQSDSFTMDQKINIFINQKGLTDAIWQGVMGMIGGLTTSQLQRLVMAQPYFTDTIQKYAIASVSSNIDFLTALLTRNRYLSDNVIQYMTTAPMTGTLSSYEKALAAQSRLLPDDILTNIVNDPKLTWRMIVPVFKQQQLVDSHYRGLINRPALTTVAITDLFLTGESVPSDTVLYYFFMNRTTTVATAQSIIDRMERPLPNYLKTYLTSLFPLIVFKPWDGYNPLSQYCSNPLHDEQLYIENKTEYEYYETDYRGYAQGKAYELLMGMISSIEDATTFPKTVPDHTGSNVSIPALRLKYEPSWQLFATKRTSPHLTGAYQREEYFYLYDLQNRYGRHWANYDVKDNPNYLMDVHYNGANLIDTVVYNELLAAEYKNTLELPKIPEFDAMTKSRQYKMRNLAFQKTNFSKNSASELPVAISEYYHYDARWRFDDLTSESTVISYQGEPCPPSGPSEPSCPCIYENHVFGDYEMALLENRYPLDEYCYYHLGGDGTGWQYAYWVCPKNVDAYLCYGDAITSEICENTEVGGNPGGPVIIPPIGEMVSQTLQLRSVSIQVDVIDYLSSYGPPGGTNFVNKKWDRKNKYVAEFAMDGTVPDADGFRGLNYRMIHPFTSLQTQKIVKRNRHFQVALEEDAMQLKTRYYYSKPTHNIYKNTMCESDIYTTTVYRSTALPVRITLGWDRADSLSTTYSYTDFAQVKRTIDPNGIEMVYEFDGLKRLSRVTEGSGPAEIMLSEYRYSLWDRASSSASFMTRAAYNYVQKKTFDDEYEAGFSYTREYVDPLGRTAGAVAVYNEEGKTRHLYSGNVLYDKWNRAHKQFKNVALAPQTIGVGQIHVLPNFQYNYTTPFTESDLERTPKSRVKETADFGVSITDPLDKTVRTSYAIANNAYMSCELNLVISEHDQIMRPGNTSAFRFYRTQTLDQDNNKSVVYTNAFGQTVGTISYIGNVERAITLFIYDNQGNVSKVINPEKQQSTYEYNLLGQLYREVTPDAGEKKYMYNKRGQVSVSLDRQLWTNMNGLTSQPLYRVYLYDAYGKPTEVSLMEGPKYTKYKEYGPLHYKTEFYGITDGTYKAPICNAGPTECGYFDYVFSHSSTQDWLTRYWVTQRPHNPAFPEPINQPVLIVFSDQAYHTILRKEKKYEYQIRGRLAHTESYNATGQEILRTVYSYDGRGKISTQQVYLNETPATVTNILTLTPMAIHYPAYSTQGMLLHQKVDVDNNGSAEMQYFYKYDGLGRLREVKILDNNGLETSATTITKYTYDDAEGLMKSRLHMLDKKLVETNYTYDVRSRLEDISSLNMTKDVPIHPELMRHTYYHDGEVPTYINTQQTYVPQFGFNYNGNINGVYTKYRFDDTYGSTPSLFNYPTVYGYSYDKLNRLVAADGLAVDFAVNAMPYGSTAMANAMLIGDENFIYDKIGNIKQLNRVVSHTDPLNASIVSKVEAWNYNYTAGTNRLASVSGISGTANGSYTYDVNGNLLTDSRRSITKTDYMRAAYPYFIKKGTDDISYLYSVDDQRVYKKVVKSGITTTEFYLQDVMGRTVALRSKSGVLAAKWEYYVNGTEREARLSNVTHNGMINPTEIEFYLYDHLGNTRMVYEPTYAGGVLQLFITYIADYFPYGKVLREYVNTGSGAERFLTTQHERDKETGLDYRGARYYDSDIARFLSLDPLAREFPSWSAYNYVVGNPISLIDPTGRSPEGTGNGDKDKKKKEETPASLDPERGGDFESAMVIEQGLDYGGMFKERNDKMLNNAVSLLTGSNKDLVLNTSVNEANSSDGNGSEISPWGPGLISAGYPSIPKDSKVIKVLFGHAFKAGTNPNTSVASVVLRKALPGSINNQKIIPKVVTNKVAKYAGTKTIGGIAGRFVPWVGWAIFASDVWTNREEIKESAESVVKTREKAIELYGPGVFCFEKGTLVYTKKGLLPIEDIIPGDSVYSYNFSNKIVELSSVTHLFSRKTNVIYKLEYDNEVLYVTEEHPFYVIDKGWVPVKDLKNGDELKSYEKTIRLSSVSILEKIVTVYNIEVDKNHNYFVSNNKVLVHNKNIPKLDEKLEIGITK